MTKTLRLPRSILRRTAKVNVQQLRYSTRSTVAAPTQLIRVSNSPAPHTGSIRVLSLNRPNARNALSRQLLHELRSHVQIVRDEGGKGSTRVLILASEVDSCFCAGADLKERAGFSGQETKEFLSSLRATFAELSSLPIPTISALSSIAFGGGLELALTTHLRVFASTAVVSLPETRLGIIPGAGGTYRLPALIGNRALDLILTGRRVAAPEAYFLGICDRLVEVLPEESAVEGKARAKVLDEAFKLAREVCDGAPLAVSAALKAVKGATEDVENSCYEDVVVTEDRNEALKAFREKRKPAFQGR
ncbi:MAG: hypothetical protein M1812_000330 [Candelaria pacifica]|nr:MAG: hypothetical protein M1812_000330 [Candelaria pacifica]